MNIKFINKSLLLIFLFIGIINFASAQNPKTLPVEQKNVEASMEFLAGDALQGRGSGTQFEWIAAEYFASLLKQFGVKPAGDADRSEKNTYLQTIEMTGNSFSEPPQLSYQAGNLKVVLQHGTEMIIFRISRGRISGGLHKLELDEEPKAGAINLIRIKDEADEKKLNENEGKYLASKAAAFLIEETPQFRRGWNRFASRLPSFSSISGKPEISPAFIILSHETAEALSKIGDGTNVEIGGKLNAPQTRKTWNAVGMIEGTDAKLSSEVILLSAHLDHLGFRENAPGEDKIFNGADDDASGCVAVLELARVLSQGERPKRTVYFAFFGSEEAGGHGSRYFVNNLPFPKEKLIANLQWEMIGRPDPKIGKDELWLTGFELSNLGAELVKQGAKLVNDPHPEQNFFRRSDNYNLARQGIIAHTVSSFGLHPDYHQASDELKTIDFAYMTGAINSMVKPIQWLINSDFKPSWYDGKKP